MTWLHYLWQVSVCITAFYAVYLLLLRQLTFFAWNRWYLLIALVISWIIPALEITVPANAELIPESQSSVEVTSLPLPVAHSSIRPQPTASVSLDDVLLVIYLMGVAAMFIRLLRNVYIIVRHIRQSPGTYVNGMRIVTTNRRFTNASFFKVIFLNTDQLLPDEQAGVLAHETVHVRKKHSWDVMWLEVSRIALWWNPVVHWYKQSLAQVHEYEVDAAMIRQMHPHVYADMLLKLNANVSAPFAHRFSRQPLADRIHMLFHAKSSIMKKGMYLLFLPVAALTILLFACQREPINATDESFAVPKENAFRIYGEELGKNPLVLIDGKGYSANVLTQVDPSKMRTMATFSAEGAMKKFGERAREGAVELTTKNGKFLIETEQEWQNIIKIRSVPANQHFARITLKENDGREYDRIILRKPAGGGASVDVAKNENVLFMIDDREMSEEEIRNLNPAVVNSFKTFSAGPAEHKLGERGKRKQLLHMETGN